MGKKWKRKNKQNQGMREEDVQIDFPEPESNVRDRLGWKKPLSSKAQKKKNKRFQNALGLAADDVEMSGGQISKNRANENPVISTGWHRVTLTQSAKYSKEVVLQALANALSLRSLTLEPIAFKLQGTHYSFYVESPLCASALKVLDQKISISPNDPFLLRIKVVTSQAPQMVMNEEAIASLKLVMSTRFNSTTGCINLARFHNDSAFLGRDVYVPLARSSVMSNVIKIINENVPQVVSLDLSHNKLPSLDYFSTLETPALKSLNLEDNRIEIRQLEKLSSLKLVELCVKNNPMWRDCDINEEKREEMTSRVRDILPSLQILNGITLPKKISFGDDDDSATENLLPKSVKKLATNDHHVNELVLHFLREFFAIYDSDKREGLLQAYHEEAKFSLGAAYPPGCSAHGVSKLQDYQVDSRNLKLVTKKTKRDKLLKQDRLSIVSFLSSLPRTTHDLNSFTLDIPFCSASLITFTITGIFRERVTLPTAPVPLRYFNRMFVVAPGNGSVTIVNDILFVTVPTKEQLKALEVMSSIQVPGVSKAPTISELAKLVNTLCQVTGMNPEWSRKCLEETHWNYDSALSAFQAAFQQSLIPPEAFTK